MRLSIIIIEYYCMDQVADCINSINQFLGNLDKECLVVSNSEYSEYELDFHQKELVNTRILDTRGNLGYAGGVNKGIEHAVGDYLYVLNPDCLLTDSNIVQIMDGMDKDEKWAITGPKVVDENNCVQPSCRRFPKPWTFLLVRSYFSKLPGASKEYNRYLMSDYDRDSRRSIDWVSGGAILIKSSVLSDIGGMDERYFLYMEDVDWCRSAWSNGYRVLYCPDSTVKHAGQHQSIKFNFGMLKNMHLWWHLMSLFKYYLKYNFRIKPDSDIYKQTIY